MNGLSRPVVLIAESIGFPVSALQVLEAVAEVKLANLDRSSLLAAVCEADVLWVRLRHHIDQEVLDAGGHLRILATPTTGLTHVDLDAARRRGIAVVSLQGEVELLRNIRATAEHTIGLMLALLRRLPTAVAHVLGGGWCRDDFRGHDLFGRAVGVVGHGRLGRIVSRYLLAFGAEVLTTDPEVSPGNVEAGAQWVEMDELLGRSEIVTLHVDVRPESRGFFDRARIRAMRRGALLVNTSRGELVDEVALHDALESGHLGGAALDVLAGEQSEGMGHHPLVKLARAHGGLIITPHIGGNTHESLATVENWLAGRVVEVLGGASEVRQSIASVPSSIEVA